MTFNPRVPARALTPSFGSFQLRPSHLVTGHAEALADKDERLAAEHRHLAVRAVCGNATDAGDAAAILEVLGLDPAEGLR
jgi:hypothetical protein